MQLNQYDRSAFVRAVMNDVPVVPYDDQAKKLAVETLLSLDPPEVKALRKAGLAEWLKSSYIYLPGNLQNFYFYTKGEGYELRTKTPEVWKKLEELNALMQKQGESLRDLENSVEAAIKACKTLKQAEERLPEFKKYLPTERGNTGTMNLPVVANLVADLTKAGWPKGKAA